MRPSPFRPALPLGVLVAGVVAGCAGPPARSDADLRARAVALAQEAVIVDTHIDVPYRLRETWEDVAERTAGGHFDYPRARAGGLDVAFMSIYVPSAYQTTGGARALADSLIDEVEALARRAPERFAVVASPADVARHRGSERVLLALGMENGAPVEGDLASLRHFYDRGVRYVTLTHATANEIADSSYDPARPWNGLSPFGEGVVREMNRLGMMVDVSHVSDSAFYDVLRVARAPVIASHSSARAFTPGWERNMDDAMIGALARNGGVVQISFGSAFISQAYHDAQDRREAALLDSLRARGLAERPEDDAEREAYADAFAERHPLPRATVAEVADHVAHVARLVGVDHVGLGSDFDGVASVPVGLADVSEYPNLVAELLRRGFSEDDVRKVLGGNLLRVWRAVEEAAGR
jgi:membrane dipeptidase